MDIMVNQEAPGPAPPACFHSKNPMEIDAILHHLFDEFYFTADDLKKFRLVNSTWRHAMSSRWKRLSIPVTLRQNDTRELIDEVTTTAPVSGNLASNARKKPNHYFILNGWTIKDAHLSLPTDNGNISNALQHRFWMSQGQNIKTLVLITCLLPYSHFLLTETLWASLPNVENLAIKNCRLDYGKDFVERRRESRRTRWRRFKKHMRRRTKAVRSSYAEWVEASTPAHLKLKSLWLENIKEKNDDYATIIHWPSLPTMFPNLMILNVCRLLTCGFGGTLENQGNLSILNMTDVTHTTFLQPKLEVCPFNWTNIRLHSLMLKCDRERKEANEILVAITSQRETLLKLELRRSPINFKDLPSLPCEQLMPSLTELYLAGNFSQNLNFLRFMPQLKIFKWDTKCYCSQQKYERLSRETKERILFRDSDKIVEKTVGFDNDFRLTHLHTLELDWAPGSSASWQMLGKWMPNVVNLKGVVNGDGQLAQIAKQWCKLEDMEMAHGSDATTDGILDVVMGQKLFQHLRNFTWRPCDCKQYAFEREQKSVENELKNRVGRKLILPWMRSPIIRGKGKQSICYQWFA